MCEAYKPHVIALMEVGKNDRDLRGYTKINSPIEYRGGVDLFIHEDLVVLKADAM